MHKVQRILLILFCALSLPLPSATGLAADPVTERAPTLVDLRTPPGIAAIVPALAKKEVVFVGEVHDRFDHHLNQLAIIRALHAIDTDLAIGVEFFQQPFQRYLDDYIAGKIPLQELLRKTEYYDRWRYDFRLYAPIVEFAREHATPLIALTTASEITSKVGRTGLASLGHEEKRQIPEIDFSDSEYRERMKEVFAQHRQQDQGSSDFENFLAVQLLWDESMAARAVEYLKHRPATRLIVLAGGGHLMHRAGIPQRMTRRLTPDIYSAVVLQGGEDDAEPGVADYLLLSPEQALPPAGTLGLLLSPAHGPGLAVQSFADGSAAGAAGVSEGDRILSLDGEPITKMSDVRLAMWDKRPGDAVRLVVHRGEQPEREVLTFDIRLR